MGEAAMLNLPGWAERIGSGGALSLLLPVTLGLLVLCALLFVFSLMSRRRLVHEIREIVLVLEELRAGRSRRRAEAGADSPLALVADAVNRLRQDVEARLHDADNAAERLRAVLDAVRDSAVITTDMDGDIRTFSPGATALFGWSEEEVVAKPASLLFVESSYKEFLPKLARRALRERGIDAGAALLRQDGSEFPAHLSVRMLRNAADHAIGFVLVIRDVTRQAKTEEDLRLAERRYRGLVEGLADGVLIVRDGRVVYVNPAFAALSGSETRRVEGTPLRDRVATADVLLVEEKLAALQGRPGSVEQLRCSLIGPDGLPSLRVSLSATAVEHLGEPAVLLLVRDETRERGIEAELRRNETQLDAVLEHTSDGILVLNEGRGGGVVRITNRAFGKLFDVRQQELLGRSPAELSRLLARRGEGGRLLAGMLASPTAIGRRSLVLGGDSPREVEVSLTPLTDRRGARLGRLLACRDLTDQRESQRKLQHHAEELQLSKVLLEQAYRRLDAVNKEMQARTDELDRLNEELRTLDEMKSNLLGNVSHELQTPLVSIRGYTEMILKERLGPLTGEQRKGLGLCLKNIDRLIAMIDNLLAFSRSEPEQGELRLTRFPLRELVEEAGELLDEKLRARGIRLSTAVEPAGLAVLADRDRILQVFLNLLSNAIKFNRQSGRILVKAGPGKPGFIDVQLEDTGVGIPKEALDRIFDRHYRVGREVGTAAEGSGIGLSIVRDVLRLHGCRIDVQSEEERGTRFSFTLPAGGEASVGAGSEPETPPSPEPPAPSRDDSPTKPPADEPRNPTGRRPRFRVIRHFDS
jgi:PAS domain S-box-containing protein